MPISSDIIQACRETFADLELDAAGTVSSTQLRQVLQGPDGPVPEGVWHELFDHLDVDGDGRVSLAELITGMARSLGPDDQTPAHRLAFDLFDRNGDGRLEAAELARAAQSLGHRPEDTPALLAAADLDGDGTLEYVEFLRLVR